MQRRGTWRERLLDQMAEIAIRNPNSPIEDVIEVVCLCSGVSAEMYYKELTDFALRRMVKEVQHLIWEVQKPDMFITEKKGGDSESINH